MKLKKNFHEEEKKTRTDCPTYLFHEGELNLTGLPFLLLFVVNSLEKSFFFDY